MIFPANGPVNPIQAVYDAMNQPGAVRVDTTPDITMNEYQRLAARTIRSDMGNIAMTNHALHGMVSEVGELHGLHQKVYQGHMLDEEHAKKELGDALWFIAEYCTAHGWNLGDIGQLNIDKLKARYPEGFSEERSLHRADNDV